MSPPSSLARTFGLTVALLLAAAESVGAQGRGAAELLRLVSGLTVTPRVLVIGMRPEDEDSQLLAWLALGRHVQTAYLSVTRGESAPNFLGAESGATLGAVRTLETLAARRIDGAEQFFTRMYDFGFARSDSELFARWNRDSLLGDIVTTIRSFRPHVIVANTRDSATADVQHRALVALTRDAFEAAADGKRFHPLDFGDPWAPAKLYRRGPGMIVDAGAYDAELGTTYSAIALQARAQTRSQGLLDLTAPASPFILLQRVTARGDSATTRAEQSIFDDLDTTFARLTTSMPGHIAALIPRLAANADSVQRAFNASSPESAVERLARLSSLVTSVRGLTPSCRHPTAVVSWSAARAFTCDQTLLDLDASLDLLVERSTAALLVASRVSVVATADRELIAASDTAVVQVRISNHGAAPLTLNRLAVWGDVDSSSSTVEVPAGRQVNITRRIVAPAQRPLWWVGPRVANRYTVPVNSIDGLTREARMRTDTNRMDPAAMAANGMLVVMMSAGVAIPEAIRRNSDATVTLTIAGATVVASVGPIVFRHADAVVGLQDRPIVGVPDVTLNLNRAIAFVAAGKPIDRSIHVGITSHSDKRQRLSLRVVSPPGVRDSLRPNAFAIAPREQRDVAVHLRGALEPGEKQAFGVIGSIGSGPFATGFRTTQYPQLLPIRVSLQSGMWLQPVEITVPRRLAVVYVPGVSDETHMALQDVGVPVAVVPPADLLSVDLRRVTTVVFGPRAFEAHPDLLLQVPRFTNWARGGGTLVVLRGSPATLTSGALPHIADIGNPVTQRVSNPAAPVTRVSAAAALLQWPNLLTPDDWKGWIGERAPFVPTQVAPAYQRVIETHDPGDQPNQNAILVARLDKGLFIYSALTLDDQIAAGVPGALRLLVNLMSAGLAPGAARH